MGWEYITVAGAVGVLVGFLLAKLTAKSTHDAEALKKELDKTRAELTAYKEEMVAHFANSADIIDKMARDFRQLYDCMAQSSTHLISNAEAKNNPFASLPPVSASEPISASKKYDAPPRDYSDGSSGLFNNGLDSEGKTNSTK